MLEHGGSRHLKTMKYLGVKPQKIFTTITIKLVYRILLNNSAMCRDVDLDGIENLDEQSGIITRGFTVLRDLFLHNLRVDGHKKIRGAFIGSGAFIRHNTVIH